MECALRRRYPIKSLDEIDGDIENSFPPYPKELKKIANSLMAIGLNPSEFHLCPASIKCIGLWRYEELDRLLVEHALIHPLGWKIDSDGVSLKSIDDEPHQQTQIIESSENLAEYLFERVYHPKPTDTWALRDSHLPCKDNPSYNFL